MTIVLQHQFWDLEVDEEGFAVTLSFNDQLQRLRIPFAAIKVFADPGRRVRASVHDRRRGEPQGAEPVKLLGAAVAGAQGRGWRDAG